MPIANPSAGTGSFVSYGERSFAGGRARCRFFTAQASASAGGLFVGTLPNMQGHIRRVGIWPGTGGDAPDAGIITVTLTTQNGVQYPIGVNLAAGERSIMIPPDLYNAGHDDGAGSKNYLQFSVGVMGVNNKISAEIYVFEDFLADMAEIEKAVRADGTLAGSSDTTLLPAPGAGIIRDEITGTIHNRHSALITVILKLTPAGGTERYMGQFSIGPNSTLRLEDALPSRLVLNDVNDVLEANLTTTPATLPDFVTCCVERPKR